MHNSTQVDIIQEYREPDEDVHAHKLIELLKRLHQRNRKRSSL